MAEPIRECTQRVQQQALSRRREPVILSSSLRDSNCLVSGLPVSCPIERFLGLELLCRSSRTPSPCSRRPRHGGHQGFGGSGREVGVLGLLWRMLDWSWGRYGLG